MHLVAGALVIFGNIPVINFIKKAYISTNSTNTLKFKNKYKEEYKLTKFQKEALIGLILGDGFLERTKSNHNTRLRIEQSYPEKEKYFNHLYLLFKPLVSMNPSILERKPDIRTGLIYKSLYFWTLRFPCLNEFYDIFYKNKVKIILNNLNKLLTPIGLAYWIVDDGGKSSYGQTVLHTRSFSKKDVEYIQSILKKTLV